MNTPRDITLPPIKAFDLISDACRTGRRVVPLLGAGVSIDAGIPGTTHIGEYLVKVHLLGEQTKSSDNNTQWLTVRGWPDFYEINPELLTCIRQFDTSAQGKPDSVLLRNLIQTQLANEFHELFETQQHGELTNEPVLFSLLSQWRTLLRRLTGGDPALLDPFLGVLAEGHRPGKAHHYAASLTRLVGWRVLLTTNFDPLLEQALAEAGLTPEVHAMREDGVLPDPKLVSRGLSVVKLHGGRFSVRFSDILDSNAEAADRNRFLEYLGPDALLLVLGYRGGDRRVIDLIRAHVNNPTNTGSRPSVIWVCRSEPPRALSRLLPHQRIVISNFHDVGLFLQELYTRIRPTFPASARLHSAITDAPTKTHNSAHRFTADSSPTKEYGTTPIIVIVAESPGRGTSTQLATLARQHERTHRLIWCDLEDFPNVSALVSHLLTEMQMCDTKLTPLLLAHEQNVANTFDVINRPLHGSHDPLLSRLMDGLRRGKYFIAIDSMGEFGRSQVGHDLSEPSVYIVERYAQLCSFLGSLARSAAEIGESKVAFIHAPVIIPSTSPHDLARILKESEHEWVLGADSVDATSPTEIDMSQHALAQTSLWERSQSESAPASNLPAPNDELPPDINGHKVLKEIGRGGQGVVYLVRHAAFQCDLAAKVINGQRATVHSTMNPILQEAQKAILLDHPNIVRVFHAGPDPHQQAFILYEYIPSGSLREALRGRVLNLHTRMRIVGEVARALSHAHSLETPIVHRDIKPENILLTPTYQAKVVDFGLAGFAGDLTAGGGTLSYMSPEQITLLTGMDSDVGIASDIFSLGIVMFELITGHHPFDGVDPGVVRTLEGRLKLYSDEQMSLFMKALSTYPQSLSHICWKCLRLKPEDRYRSASELADAIAGWIGTLNSSEVIQQRIWQEYHKLREHLASDSADIPQVIDAPDNLSSCVTTIYAQTSVTYRTPRTEAALARIVRQDCDLVDLLQRIVGKGNSLLGSTKIIWDQLDHEFQAVLIVAAAFRRPRSIIALRRIGELLLRTMQANNDNNVLRALTRLKVSDLEASNGQLHQMESAEVAVISPSATTGAMLHNHANPVQDRIDTILEDLDSAELLIRQEGGFYWMHCSVRDVIFRECASLEPQGMANLHELIAYFYYESVFRATRDMRSINEFVAHQLLAIRESPPSKKGPRIRVLRNCVERERATLLARTHPQSILDWLRTIRNVEMPKLKHDKRNTEDATVSRSLLNDLRRTLFDIEGDVHRYATNFEAGIAIRLEQIGERIEEMKKWLRAEDFGWIAEHVKWFRSSRFAGTDESDCRRQCEVLCTHLKTAINQVSRELGDHRRDGATDFFRQFVSHIMDVAICLQGLHRPLQARTIFETIKTVVSEFVGDHDADDRNDGDQKSRPVRSLRAWASRLMCSCSLRLMDSFSGEAYTWDSRDGTRGVLNSVISEYTIAMGVLEYYSGDVRTEFARNVCILKALAARTYYMLGQFDQAHVLLDSAMASVYPENGPHERMALAVCELRHAECLMLEADSVCRNGYSVDEHSIARGRLDMAHTSLEHARQLLSAESGHVWRWSLLFLEMTQLQHEEVVFTFFGDAQTLAHSARREVLIRRALSTIGAGLDNIERDRRRWGHLAMLWWQLYLCVAVDSNRDQCGTLEFWEMQNRIAGLGWFFVQQRNSGQERDTRIAAGLEQVRSELKSCAAPNDCRKIVLDFEEAVLGPETSKM